MPNLIRCLSCGSEISSGVFCCRHCGAEIGPIPDAITREFLAQIDDDDLPDLLFQYVLAVIGDRHDDLEVLTMLPEGLLASYVLVLLDSEVRNGGFFQFFTNSSGRHTEKVLECLIVIGAARHVDVFGQAIEHNSQLEAKYPSFRQRWDEPQPRPDDAELAAFSSDVELIETVLDRLDEEFYGLDETNSLWPQFVRYVRSDPEKCVHQRENG